MPYLSPMYTDTHAHLYDGKMAEDPDHINKSIEAGVTRMYMPNCNAETIAPMLTVAEQFPSHCFPMMGLHPGYVKENVKEELDIVYHWLKQRPFAAIGEVGLDFYWDKTWVAEQEKALIQQIAWAVELELPLILHSRSATGRCIALIKEHGKGRVKGIFHCFSGSKEEAKTITDMGFLLGIGGVLTFKNAGLTEIVREIDLNDLVLETDAPYLAPHPYRGKTNFSYYLPQIAQKLADIKELPLQEVAKKTTENAEKLFSI